MTAEKKEYTIKDHIEWASHYRSVIHARIASRATTKELIQWMKIFPHVDEYADEYEQRYYMITCSYINDNMIFKNDDCPYDYDMPDESYGGSNGRGGSNGD